MKIKVSDTVESDDGMHTFIIVRGEDHRQLLHFQEGPIKEVGINGIQNIDLYDILISRLEGFEAMHSSQYNKEQIQLLKWARESDIRRTKEREKRAVEGTNQV